MTIKPGMDNAPPS